MEHIENKKALLIWAIAGVVAIGVIGYLFYLSTTADDRSGDRAAEEAVLEEESDFRETVTAKHSYSDGTHIVAGEMALPTPCHALEAVVLNEGTDDVVIRFTTTLSGGADTACAQVITPRRFKVEFSAPEGASISGTLNGDPIRMNLIEAGPDENLDEFEIFIKG